MRSDGLSAPLHSVGLSTVPEYLTEVCRRDFHDHTSLPHSLTWRCPAARMAFLSELPMLICTYSLFPPPAFQDYDFDHVVALPKLVGVPPLLV